MVDPSDDTKTMAICQSGDRICSGQSVVVYPVPRVRIWLLVILLVSLAAAAWAPARLEELVPALIYCVVTLSIVTQRGRLGVFRLSGVERSIELSSGDRIEVQQLSDLTENGRLLLFATQILFGVIAAALAYMALRLGTLGTRQPLLLLWPVGSVAWVIALGWFRRTRYTLLGSLGGRSQRMRLRMVAPRHP